MYVIYCIVLNVFIIDGIYTVVLIKILVSFDISPFWDTTTIHQEHLCKCWSGALWSIPTIPFNAILHILSVDIADRFIAAKCVRRLRKAGYIKGSEQEYAEIFSYLNCIPENWDHCIVEATSGGFFLHTDEGYVEMENSLEEGYPCPELDLHWRLAF